MVDWKNTLQKQSRVILRQQYVSALRHTPDTLTPECLPLPFCPPSGTETHTKCVCVCRPFPNNPGLQGPWSCPHPPPSRAPPRWVTVPPSMETQNDTIWLCLIHDAHCCRFAEQARITRLYIVTKQPAYRAVVLHHGCAPVVVMLLSTLTIGNWVGTRRTSPVIPIRALPLNPSAVHPLETTRPFPPPHSGWASSHPRGGVDTSLFLCWHTFSLSRFHGRTDTSMPRSAWGLVRASSSPPNTHHIAPAADAVANVAALLAGHERGGTAALRAPSSSYDVAPLARCCPRFSFSPFSLHSTGHIAKGFSAVWACAALHPSAGAAPPLHRPSATVLLRRCRPGEQRQQRPQRQQHQPQGRGEAPPPGRC